MSNTVYRARLHDQELFIEEKELPDATTDVPAGWSTTRLAALRSRRTTLFSDQLDRMRRQGPLLDDAIQAEKELRDAKV
mgnify:CR=1 FL=1